MIKNKNKRVVIIPRTVAKILNNPVRDRSVEIYEEYEPEIKESEIADITKKLSTNYNYMFMDDCQDLLYIDNDKKSKYEKLNSTIITYTCGELRFVYHCLKNFTGLLNCDATISSFIENEHYDRLIAFELALIILNQYDLTYNSYRKDDIMKAIDFIKTNEYYKNIDLSEHSDRIKSILKGIISETDLEEALKL